MRFVAMAAAWLVVLLSPAGAEEMACRFRHHGGNSIEWVEKDEPRGIRIVARDPKWSALQGTRDTHCATCPDDQIANATLHLAVGDFSRATAADLESALSPGAVPLVWAPLPFWAPGATFHAKANAVPVAIGDLAGLARRIGIDAPGGRSSEVIPLWVGKGCVSLFGLLSTRTGAEIAIDALDVFVRAIDTEWYRSAPDPSVLHGGPR
jgi:hypothetical protein